jgi:hypothetical protein
MKERKKEVGLAALGPGLMEQCHFTINLIFKSIQICNGPKEAFPNSKNFK